jgi:hypothetical protein
MVLMLDRLQISSLAVQLNQLNLYQPIQWKRMSLICLHRADKALTEQIKRDSTFHVSEIMLELLTPSLCDRNRALGYNVEDAHRSVAGAINARNPFAVEQSQQVCNVSFVVL